MELQDGEPDALHACRILIIDDEETNVRLLERVLSRAGFGNLVGTTNSHEAAALFIDFAPDLVLTDWFMPGTDGCAVLGQLRMLTAPNDYLPIVVLTADITSQTMQRALMAGATDFLTKPFDQTAVLLRIRNLLKTRLSHLTIQRQNATLEESVRARTLEVEQALGDLQRTQGQVIQQERLAALGTMAGGIAHDFNNALSIIMGFGELLLRDAEHGLTRENAIRPITTILNAAEDAARIVRRLSEFYRPDESGHQRLPIDLNQLVEQAISLTRPRWQTEATAGGRTIVLVAETGEIPSILGDATELREALTNLIFNAVDALPRGGTIKICTHQEGDFVVLHLSDTGIGMNEDVRRRCLEPFFSTKGQGGTGLGLAMVFGIVQRHGGSIEVGSLPDQGTTFTIRLPRSGPEPVPGPDTVRCARENLRVLVVDDQPILSQFLCQHLEDDLHLVETALSGSEALQRFQAGHFDLVITDHVMAEMTGEQLAVALKELNPKIPVILLTGYAGHSPSGSPYSDAIDLVLAKPLSRAALRQAFIKLMPAQAD